MLVVRRSNERGHADHGWLKALHSFSFGDYYDKKFLGFRDLVVINEDRIAGGAGFPTHGHRDMEIITYIISGALAHKDSMGNAAVMRPGEVQRMSAGSGVKHSEFNHMPDKETHLLQIWIQPEVKGVAPSYEQKSFTADLEKKELVLVVSKDGRDGSLHMNQSANVYVGKLRANSHLEFDINPGRHAWIQMVKGQIDVNSQVLKSGDGAAISEEKKLIIKSSEASEFILFDLV